MNLDISINATDDTRFVELVRNVITELVCQSSPKQVFVMKVDNWFDHKWLDFSGIGSVGFFWGLNAPDTALDPFSQDKTTFPPFNPNRIVGEWYFLRDANGEYLPSLDAPLVHQRKYVLSAQNLQNRVTHFSDSAIFVWLSSNTKSNARGSLMVYEVSGSEVHTWYAGFVQKGDWTVLQTKGISREEVTSLAKLTLSEART